MEDIELSALLQELDQLLEDDELAKALAVIRYHIYKIKGLVD